MNPAVRPLFFVRVSTTQVRPDTPATRATTDIAAGIDTGYPTTKVVIRPAAAPYPAISRAAPARARRVPGSAGSRPLALRSRNGKAMKSAPAAVSPASGTATTSFSPANHQPRPTRMNTIVSCPAVASRPIAAQIEAATADPRPEPDRDAGARAVSVTAPAAKNITALSA